MDVLLSGGHGVCWAGSQVLGCCGIIEGIIRVIGLGRAGGSGGRNGKRGKKKERNQLGAVSCAKKGQFRWVLFDWCGILIILTEY